MNRKELEDNCYTVFIVAITCISVMVVILFLFYLTGFTYDEDYYNSPNTEVVDT